MQAPRAVYSPGMERVESKTFDKTEVETDGKLFVGCNFANCMMVSCGDGETQFENCTFKDCGWLFQGAGDRTIKLSG